MELKKLLARQQKKMPFKIIVYGPPGVGKSTFGSQAPNPIFLQIEEGVNNIYTPGTDDLVPAFPALNNAEELGNYISLLENEKHEFKTLVVDTVDWLERRIFWADLCQKKRWETIDDPGFQTGQKLASAYWEKFIRRLDDLRKKGINILLLAHCQIREVNPPDSQAYSKYELKLHKDPVAMLTEWSDMTAFLNYTTYVSSEKRGKTGKATGGEERVLYPAPNPAMTAKNRYNLTEQIILSKDNGFDDLANEIKSAREKRQNNNIKKGDD